jgi:hypothetical protein
LAILFASLWALIIEPRSLPPGPTGQDAVVLFAGFQVAWWVPLATAVGSLGVLILAVPPLTLLSGSGSGR